MTDIGPGTELEGGKYRTKRRLGKGAMGEVWLAHDPKLDRDVAIKFLHDPEAQDEFEVEAKRIANLEHDNIVRVYEYNKHEEKPYFVMRHMRGGSLFDRLRAAGGVGLPIADIAEFLLRVSDALDFAHSKQIVHRDLKPANILLDDSEKAYLSDFGIAKNIRTPMTSGRVTIAGTPEYMAPEQVSGGKVTPQTDVYALGVSAFELLTGHLPFTTEDRLAVLDKHVQAPVPRLADFAPGLPSGLQAVVERAMAKEPAERYKSARSLAQDLDHATGNEPPGDETPTSVAAPLHAPEMSEGIAEVTGLHAKRASGQVTLTWKAPVDVHQIVICRSTKHPPAVREGMVAELPGRDSSWIDTDPFTGSTHYAVYCQYRGSAFGAIYFGDGEHERA